MLSCALRLRWSWLGGALTAVMLVSAAAGMARGELFLDFRSPQRARMPIAIPDFVSTRPGSVTGKALAEILRNDLRMSGFFRMVGPSHVPHDPAHPDYDKWVQAGAQAIVLASFTEEGGTLTIEARLYEAALKRMEFGKRFSGKTSDHRTMVHRFADRIMENLTGMPGSFCSRIAFVGHSRGKEIFSMDYDGANLRQITRNSSINLSPEWSPSGTEILFTSYVRGNPDLWSVAVRSGQQTVISARKGIDASARFSPDGSMICLALTFQGIPKLFLITPRGKIIKRLTSGRGNDISPTWSPDQSRIAYVSDQAGNPHIYVLPVHGGRARRLTFDTNYNTDPDWSPRGDRIAFTGRVDGRFQICTIGENGRDFRVLTDQGLNQAPAWSPDGSMIAFTSNRDGPWLIYLMDAGGEMQVPISSIPGKSPAWSRSYR